jgi:thiamine kinase-like enzyme
MPPPLNFGVLYFTDDIRLIDLEYGAINYAAFDIANHFMEYAGGTDEGKSDSGIPDYNRLPNNAQQIAFCKVGRGLQRHLFLV